MATGLDVLLGGADAPTGLDVLLGARVPTQLAPMDTNPTGSFLNNTAAGAGKFAVDTATGTKQLFNDLAAGAQSALKDSSMGRGVDWLNAQLGMQSPQDIQQQGRQDITETRKLDAPLMRTAGGNVGYVGGALATAPMLPAAAGYRGAVGTGMALGATQPAESWDERAKNATFGAAGGAAGQAGANLLSRAVAPQVSQEVRTLMDAGITPTPGQTLGGGWKRLEEAATSVPFVGDFIRRAQNRQLDALNTAVGNRALAPIGEEVAAGVAPGRDLVAHVEQKLSNAYDKVLPYISARVDPQFAGEINNLTRLVSNGNMSHGEANQFSAIARNQVLSKLQGQNGAATGETLKAMISDLERTAGNLSRDPSFSQRQLGDAVGELASSIRGMMARQNPTYAPQLKAIDEGWANFKRLQRAASSLGADEGVFTPAQLQNAVRAGDRSKDKGAFARGGALMQDLSEPAKSLLAAKVGDSGTPYRTAAIGLGAGALGHSAPAIAPFLSPWLAAPFAAAPLMYSGMGQKAMAALLTQRPQLAAPLAGAINRAPMGLLMPALTYAEQH